MPNLDTSGVKTNQSHAASGVPASKTAVYAIHLTERATGEIRSMVSRSDVPGNPALRLTAQGGGCAGLTYAVDCNSGERRRDRIVEFEGLRFFIDPKSFIYLYGMVLDYQDDGTVRGFVVINPSASKSCGCGDPLNGNAK